MIPLDPSRGPHLAGAEREATAWHRGAPAPGTAWWQPWAALAGFAFLLNFAWEMDQAPLYRAMATAPHWTAVRICTLATAGDVAILLMACGLIAAFVRMPEMSGAELNAMMPAHVGRVRRLVDMHRTMMGSTGQPATGRTAERSSS